MFGLAIRLYKPSVLWQSYSAYCYNCVNTTLTHSLNKAINGYLHRKSIPWVISVTFISFSSLSKPTPVCLPWSDYLKRWLLDTCFVTNSSWILKMSGFNDAFIQFRSTVGQLHGGDTNDSGGRRRMHLKDNVHVVVPNGEISHGFTQPNRKN